jgi:hypothetical protein
MKEKLTWKQLFIVFIAIEVISVILSNFIVFNSYPLHEVIRAIIAALQIGAVVAFIVAVIEMFKAIFSTVTKKKTVAK